MHNDNERARPKGKGYSDARNVKFNQGGILQLHYATCNRRGVESNTMKIVRMALGYQNPHMVMAADFGDFLPGTITIHHNGREIEYKQ